MMRKPLIVLLHIGYWFVYLLLAVMMMYALSSSEDIGGAGAEEVLAAAFFCIILLPAIVFSCWRVLIDRNNFSRLPFRQSYPIPRVWERHERL